MEAHTPIVQLQPFIKTYLVIESQEEIVNRVLPGTAPAMAFRYKGQANYLSGNALLTLPATVVSGLRKSVRLIHYTKNTGNIIVVFKEAGAAAFFKEPLQELFEESISLNDLVAQQQISIIEEQLAAAQNTLQRIAVVEQFLLSKLLHAKKDQLVETAIQKIYTEKGIIKIKSLADTLYISQDAFEKRFRKVAGTSPKQFSSIVRMKAAIANKLQTQSLADIAFDAGYYDQPHFTKDFKIFTGQTPAEFFKSPLFW